MLNQYLYKYINTLALENSFSIKERAEFLVRWSDACFDNPDLLPAFIADCLLAVSESRPFR
jgi:hypothetical protein